MIEPKELRIGNYVQYLCDSEPIHEVTGLSDEDISLKGVVSFDYIAYDEVVAIPITEELLIKLGFKKLNGWDDQEYYELIRDNNIQLLKCDNGFENGFQLKINSIHQLQNYVYGAIAFEITIDETK